MEKSIKFNPRWEHASFKKARSLSTKTLASLFFKSKGINVWDLENKKYFDMSLMGIGTNILGYANKKVNDRINLTLKKSNMSTLNCPEEVTLAENLIKNTSLV